MSGYRRPSEQKVLLLIDYKRLSEHKDVQQNAYERAAERSAILSHRIFVNYGRTIRRHRRSPCRRPRRHPADPRRWAPPRSGTRARRLEGWSALRRGHFPMIRMIHFNHTYDLLR